MFSNKYPDVKLEIIYGNHDELYRMLISEEIDIAFNDQRRKFSDGYNNILLSVRKTFVEVSINSKLAKLKKITAEDLKNIPCILVSSDNQKDIEYEYYYNIMGFKGDYLFVSEPHQARLMVMNNQGFMIVDEGSMEESMFIKRIELCVNDFQHTKNYCLFWEKENSGYYIEELAECFKQVLKN